MMRERAPEGMLATDLQRLEQSIGFCQQFVRRLLDFSRRPALQKQPEEIVGMMEAVLAFLAPSITARQARLSCDLQPLQQQRVLADRNQMETVLLILLSNALDAIAPGGRVRIEGGRPGAELVEIAIVDDGCGIAEADLANLFEPFFTTKPPGKGTGLGLAIARSIVTEHGGTLRLQGKPGQGARASLQLPACAPAPRLEEVVP
jgi:signal transduction histidine kinase